MTNKQNTHEWDRIISEWRKSGQARKEFCLSYKIKPTTFDYWRRKLLKPAVLKETGEKQQLIKVPITFSAQPPQCRLIVNNSCILEFPSTIDPESLKRVIMAMRECL